MGHYLLELTLALLLLNQLQLGSVDGVPGEEEDEECLYWFVKEPPLQISCDPYPYQTLSLSCTLLLRNSSIPAPKIQWHHIDALNDHDRVLATAIFPPVTATHDSNYVALTSQIIVVRVLEGEYYCMPEVEGVGFLPSYPTTVEPYGSYRFEATCDSEYLSDPSVRCAQEGYDIEKGLPAEIEEIVNNISFIRDVQTNILFFHDAPPIIPLPGCLYQYMVEPFRRLACNPYEHGELSLVCMILADGRVLKPDREFNIQWYYSPGRGQPVLIHKKSFNFTSSAESRGILYVMKITNVQEGAYYCQPFLEDIGLLLPSTHAVVRPQGSYDHLMPCETDLPVRSSSALQCIITVEEAGSTVNESSSISRSRFNQASGQVRLNDTLESSNSPFETTDPPTQRTNPPTENGDSTIESSDPRSDRPTESSDPPTEDSLPVWVYILAAIGGVLLVGGTSTVLLVAAYCYKRKLKTRAKHATNTRQGQNGERVHTGTSDSRERAHRAPLNRREGVSGPSVLSITNTVIQELSEVSDGQNREIAHIRYSNSQPLGPNQTGTAPARSEGDNSSSVRSTTHTQTQSGVAVRCSIQTLQEEEPYYSYPLWNVQQQNTENSEDDEYIYMRSDSSAVNSTRGDHTGRLQERDSQASTESEPAPYEVPDPYTVDVNSVRSSRPSTGMSTRDRRHKYKGLKIESKDYVSMYDIVVRIPRRGASKSCVY